MPETWIALLLFVAVVVVATSSLGAWPWGLAAAAAVWLLLRRNRARPAESGVGADALDATTTEAFADVASPDLDARALRTRVRFSVEGVPVEIRWFFSGLETYEVDGVEVLRIRSLALYGTRSFAMPRGQTVEIRIVPPLNAYVWIDGEQASDDFLEGFVRQVLLSALPWLAPTGVALGVVIFLLMS